MSRRIIIVCIILLGLSLGTAQAKVSPEKAAKLKGELTPVGAVRAGNADGTIPEWTGDIKNLPPHKKGEWLTNPFADEKPLFSITGKNYKQYADKLSPGQIAMFEKNIPNWRMDIYPTHRIVKLPNWIEEGTYNNALTAELIDGGNGVEGAYGGIPFPIPNSGGELVQNNLMRYWGSSTKLTAMGLEGYKNGSGVETYGAVINMFFPYYQKGQESANDPHLFYFTNYYTVPARRKGEQLIVNDFLNANKHPRQAWQYIPGQRRVRRAPTIAFDTPDMPITTYDDAYMYNGSPERYDWKIIGKKEMYIPYNSYDLESSYGKGELSAKDMSPGYPKDLAMRWELHRVWVLEGIVKEGERHIYAKRIFFIDEDSWCIAIQERFDAKGNLWRSTFGNVFFEYGESQTTQSRPLFTMDLLSGEYMLWYLATAPQEVVDPPLPLRYFSPQGLRKRSRR